MNGRSGESHNQGIGWINRGIVFLIFLTLAYLGWHYYRHPDFWKVDK